VPTRLTEAVGARINQKAAVGVVFVAAMFMSIMDVTIVNVALPTIGRDFKVSPTAVDAISIAFLVGRGLSALGSGLSTFPEALGVMGGAQLASRVLYPRLGPRRHITIGLVGTAASIALLALMGPQTSLWWARLLMFTLGLSMAQVFVPVQAASFATITSAATGRASTLFNAIRQLGGAIGVASRHWRGLTEGG
jgi:MFS family permease